MKRYLRKFSVILGIAVTVVSSSGDSCKPDPTEVNTDTDVLSELTPSTGVDSTYAGDTIFGPALVVRTIKLEERQVVVDWTSSNPAVLKLVGAGTTRTSDDDNTGARFLGMSEGDAEMVGTLRGTIKTQSGQPLVYRSSISVAGTPSSLKIAPVSPVALQMDDPTIANSPLRFRPKATVRSASGRTMRHVSVRWTLPDIGPAKFCDAVTPANPTAYTTTAKVMDVAETPVLCGVAIGLSRLQVTLEPQAGRTLPTLADEIVLTVGGGQVLVSSVPAGVTQLDVGSTQNFAAQVKDPSGAVLPSPVIQWSTSRSATATVDQTGKVTALAASADGDTVSVLAYVPGLGITGIATFTVYRKVATFTVTPSPINLFTGASQRAIAHFADAAGNPVRRSSKLATWSVPTNQLVASIAQASTSDADTSRFITANAPGDIALTVSYPGLTPVLVPVHVITAATRVTITVAQGTGSRPLNLTGEPVLVGGTVPLIATATDANLAVVNETINFTTGSPTIVSITKTGAGTASITGLAPGTALVTAASSSDISVTSIATIIVTAVGTGGPAVRIAITSVPASGIAAVGGNVQYTGVPKDINGVTASNCPIGWAVDQSAVGGIGTSGLAVGFGAGTSAVRAFCTDAGGVAAAAKLTIVDAVFGVSQVNVTPRFVYLAPGGTFPYVATVVQSAPGPVAPVTWGIVQPVGNTVTFSQPGQVVIPTTGTTSGGAKIVATSNGQSDTAWVTYGNAGSIKGTVVSPTGQYLGASTATATPTLGGAPFITGLNNEGIFYLAGLPPGSYTVFVRQQGNPNGQQVNSVIVTAGGTTLLTLNPFAIVMP